MTWSPDVSQAGPPRELAAVPPTQRVDETNPWLAGTLAVAGLLVAIGTLVDILSSPRHDDSQLKLLGGALAATLLFGGYEIYRRTRRSALAFLPDRTIAIYTKGQLVGHVHAGQISWFKLNVVNTIREFMLFGIFALGGVFGLTALNFRGGFLFFVLAACLGSISAFASSIYDRVMCVHYVVPGAGNVAFPKSKMRAVASGHGMMGF